jgi:hypothetical protein
MKCPFVSKMHVYETMFATKVDEIYWDLIHQPSDNQSNALPDLASRGADTLACLNAIFFTVHAS